MNRVRLGQLIFFPLMFVLGLWALYIFFVDGAGFVQDYLNDATYIVYDRGLWAMLGCGIGLLGIVVLALGELLPNLRESERAQIFIIKLLLVSMGLMFGLPLITSLVEGPLLKERGYLYCRQAAYPYQGRSLGTKNYVKSAELCLPWEEFREQLDRYRANRQQQ